MGDDPDDCRPTDPELNGLVVVTGEAVKPEATDPVYTIERLYRGIDLEVFYYNNPYDGAGNCDREGPLLGAGPYDGEYHRLEGDTLTWSVPASDDGGVWRVVVVYNDNTTSDGQGAWVPIELELRRRLRHVDRGDRHAGRRPAHLRHPGRRQQGQRLLARLDHPAPPLLQHQSRPPRHHRCRT